ncbi:MAG: hypothetical protein ACYTF1_15730 [Planctomycetota bacterium]
MNTSLYVGDNYMEDYPEANQDNWLMIDYSGGVTALPDPLPVPAVTTTDALTARGDVLSGAGATLPVRDPLDVRVVNDVIDRTGGIIDSQTEVGGWPTLISDTPPADSDHDGMPDAWENGHGLNPSDPADGPMDADGDGYTNVEDYLNEIALRAANPTPSDEKMSVSIEADLTWSKVCGATSYDVYFGTTNPPAFQGSQAEFAFDPGTMAHETTHFWRIDTVSDGGTTTGPLWRFTTEPVPVPDPTTNPSPADQATGVAPDAQLAWTGGANTISYDVCLGTSDPPTFQINQAATVYVPGPLEPYTRYYWRVDAVNDYLTTSGQVWTFRTMSCPADFDDDNDVDLEDFGHFQICLSGPGVPQTDPDCQDANLDGDDDVDLNDFGTFLSCLSGANIPADPSCAD